MIAIYGSTHIGVTLAKRLLERDSEVIICDSADCPEEKLSQIYIKTLEYKQADIYYLVFDDDGLNVKQSLLIKRNNPDARIYTVLRQSSLGEKVKKNLKVKDFEYINPSVLVSKKFVDSIQKASHTETNFISRLKERRKIKMDPIIKIALTFVFGLIVCSTLFFHLYNKLSFIDALYFTSSMMGNVGFSGDFSIEGYDSLSKGVAILVMVLSIASTAIIFALVADMILRKRQEFIYGVKKFKGKDHVIVIGGGSVGFRVIEELISRGETPVLIDKNLSGTFIKNIHDLKVPFVIGDAKNESILLDAGLERAKAVIAVTQDDLVNLEVGLDVKTINPNMCIALRIYDQELAQSLKEDVGIEHTFSMSYVASTELLMLL